MKGAPEFSLDLLLLERTKESYDIFWWKILFLFLYQVESTQLFMCLFASKRLHFAMVKALHVGDRTTDQKRDPNTFY